MLAFCLFMLWAASPEADVKAVLEAQASAWNRGDIEAFMQTYEDSPEITFQGKSGVTRGYRSVLERYRKNYSTPAAMGTLKFSELEVRLLGADYALVLGRFDLARTEAGGGAANGRFTLILKRGPAGWKILHDHTS